MEATLHHIEVCSREGKKMVSKLRSIMCLEPLATRKTPTCQQWVLRGNGLTVTVTERKRVQSADLFADNSDAPAKLEDWTVFCCCSDGESKSSSHNHTADSVFNIALRVKNIQAVVGRSIDFNGGRSGGIIIRDFTSISDKHGTVRYAIIKSCVGNVVHTLIDDSQYGGIYLPGYKIYDNGHKCNRSISLSSSVVTRLPARHHSVKNSSDGVKISRINGIRRKGSLSGIQSGTKSNDVSNQVSSRTMAVVQDNSDFSKTSVPDNYSSRSQPGGRPLYNGVDHVAFACPVGSYSTILKWYKECMGFKRFLVNQTESEEDGFVINMNEDVGMRLLAMEYWKCRENGILSAPCDPNVRPLKLVLAESLVAGVPDQISAFIKAHGCAGVQHIALNCPNIFRARTRLQDNGLDFLMTPKAYYYEDIIQKRVEDMGLDWSTLSKTGILVDTDEEENTAVEQDNNNNELRVRKLRYLLQIFTKPLFSKDTFFLELIERHGTDGFGAGNIPALWRTIRKYMEDMKLQSN